MLFIALVALFIQIREAEGAVLALLISGLITQLYFAKCALSYIPVEKVKFLWKVLSRSSPFAIIPMIISTYFLSTGFLDTMSLGWTSFLISVFVFVALSLLPIPILIYKHGSFSKAIKMSFSYET